MKTLLIDMFHIVTIFMTGSFIILCLIGVIGEFDQWTARSSRRQKMAKETPVPVTVPVDGN